MEDLWEYNLYVIECLFEKTSVLQPVKCFLLCYIKQAMK